ncbi:uncharacterized protein LOC103517011 isoform X2 [Diaphorina citri]|uniref:Uncharacterized protein LOC103517011 isoform X2 n=1 Tax=Diaphorina citri TaxID=121845 RepID=A0A3Q0J986_DIACI|nr:uncharacterized protein LOC103517011 isoform X2 [Diaphorina citri]
MEITASHNTFVQMFNLELNKKNIHDVEMTKDNYKHVLANENKKTKTLQEELKRVDLENKDLKRQIQSYKLEIDNNKMDYTNLIFALRNELKSETNRLNVLNERNKELDNIIKNQKAHLEKVQANIENEIRKRKNVERKIYFRWNQKI